MLKNIITGGSGFIGTHLLNHLGGGIVIDHHAPKAPNSTRVYFEDIIFSPNEFLDRHDVVHLYILQSRKIPMFGGRAESTSSNLHGLLMASHLAKAIHFNGNEVKIFYASTSDVYGNPNPAGSREIDFVSLGDPSSSRWSYGACKIVGEHLFLGLMEELKIPVVVGRIFSAYGPYGNLKEPWKAGILQVLIHNAIKNEITTIYGDGSQKRSFLYIDDLIKALDMLMNGNFTGVYNICSDDEPQSVNYFINLVSRIHRDSLAIEYKGYEEIKQTKYSDVQNKRGNNNKLKEATGWSPTVNIEDGIKLTYQYVLEELSYSD